VIASLDRPRCARSRAIECRAPAAAGPQVNEGLVVAVGPGRRNMQGDIIPPSVKEGDKVLLPEYGGNAIKMGEKE
jgi:chaperonin GroES